METEEDLYEVERIVDRRRTCQGQVQYLVRWRGYGSDCDTWEPEEHLQSCSPHVHDFNQRLLKERHRVLQRSTHRLNPGPAPSPGPAHSLRDLNRSGIKILVPKSPMVQVQEQDQDQSRPLPDSVPASSPALETQCVGTKAALGPGEERARMGTRPRSNQNQNRVPVNPGALRPVSGSGAALLEGVANGGGVSAAKRRLDERFDKRLRFSVRQTESAYRYRHLVVRKQEGFTHIVLSTRNSQNNALNPEVMRELQGVMATAACDDSKLLLLTSVGPVFCSGLDFLWFLPKLTEDRRRESARMAEALRTFVNALVQFPKPLVAAVNGPAVGLGAAILGLCDVVWANEKAWIQTPYAQYGHTPDGCSSYTLPLIMGPAAAGELLLGGRRLTALEACSRGLVSQVLWPHTFNQEVQRRIRELLSADAQLGPDTDLLNFCSRLERGPLSAAQRSLSRSLLIQTHGTDGCVGGACGGSGAGGITESPMEPR
ncbi:chromodomain Y-like protein [Boleophthalmus pectinirostris]|uniref:chromodomain Y-like protein n=1 Tax=Boleophthalmus pectinirostris TaxID=150288 RepID=UPI002430069A|nr:chromodomain Y-like protein [Boleophthalmus pectinirostris]